MTGGPCAEYSLGSLPEELAGLRDKALCSRACRALRVSIAVTLEVYDHHLELNPPRRVFQKSWHGSGTNVTPQGLQGTELA